jgi:hypothetical protein
MDKTNCDRSKKVLTRLKCSYMSIGGGCKGCQINAKRGNMSCWDWAEDNEEFVNNAVAAQRTKYGIDDINKAYCDDCHVIYNVSEKEVFKDEYVGSYVFRCSRCGQMIPVAEPKFVV